VRIMPDPNSRHPVPAKIGDWATVDVTSSDDHDLDAIFIRETAV